MKPLSKVIFFGVLLSFFTVSYSYLYPENKWPPSFENFYFRNVPNKIINMFEDDYTKLLFNKGYNPGTHDRSPINEKLQKAILKQLIPKSNEALSAAVEQLKNCPAFNDLFGKSVEKGGVILCLAQQYDLLVEKEKNIQKISV